MNNKEFKELLTSLGACSEAMEWVGERSWSEVYRDCPRGEWLIWLFVHVKPDAKRERVGMAALAANTVRHLMTDERSTAAVDAAFAYSRGEIGDEELRVARAAGAAAWAAAPAWAATAAAYAAEAARRAAAYAAADEEANHLLVANLIRENYPIEAWGLEVKG